MNNVIVVPTEIKIGLYTFKVIEIGTELVAVCGYCSERLQANSMERACESKWIFCSDACVEQYVKEYYDPDGDNENI